MFQDWGKVKPKPKNLQLISNFIYINFPTIPILAKPNLITFISNGIETGNGNGDHSGNFCIYITFFFGKQNSWVGVLHGIGTDQILLI